MKMSKHIIKLKDFYREYLYTYQLESIINILL